MATLKEEAWATGQHSNRGLRKTDCTPNAYIHIKESTLCGTHGLLGGVPWLTCGFRLYVTAQFHGCHQDFYKQRGTNFSHGGQHKCLLRKLN
jgi:hypothetical protein